MTRVELLKAAGDGFHSKLTQFLLLAGDKTHLICVFEGNDHYYFGPRIDLYLPDHKIRRNLSMGGRYNVLRLNNLRLENKAVENASAVYFVDRDYGFLPPLTSTPGNLYVTSGYSIESYYCLPEVLETVLHDAFHVSREVLGPDGIQVKRNPEMDGIISAYNSLLQGLKRDVLVPLNAFVRAALANDPLCKSQLKLWDFSLSELASISLAGHALVGGPITLDRLNVRFGLAQPVSSEAYEKQLAILESEDMAFFGRGKFAAEILGIVIKELWDDSKKSNNRQFFLRKRTPGISFSKDTILADLSSFAHTPECLKVFLEPLRHLPK